MRFYSPKTKTTAPYVRFRTHVGRTNKMLGNFRQRKPFSNPLDESSYTEAASPLMDREIQTPDHEALDAGPRGHDAPIPPPAPRLSPAYTITNGMIDRTFNVTGTTTAELARVLYTLITDLKSLGVGIK